MDQNYGKKAGKKNSSSSNLDSVPKRKRKRSHQLSPERRVKKSHQLSKKRRVKRSRPIRKTPENSSKSSRRQSDSGSKKIISDQESVDEKRTEKHGDHVIPSRFSSKKLKQMLLEQSEDKGSEFYQRLAWEQLKRVIQNHVNRVNRSNLPAIVHSLISTCNIVRGRGVLARCIIQAQRRAGAGQAWTPVYAALVAVLNTKFPLLGKRIVLQLVKSFKLAIKSSSSTTITAQAPVIQFIAHLVNHLVVHEILALEICMMLLHGGSNHGVADKDYHVDLAVKFVRACGARLAEVSPRGIAAVFDRFRSILNNHNDATKVSRRVQFAIESLFACRKYGFPAAISQDLDLIETEDAITHQITLDDQNFEEERNTTIVFQFDPHFQRNEEAYRKIRQDILDGEADTGADSDKEDGEESADSRSVRAPNKELIASFRKSAYLTLQSSVEFEGAAHKLIKLLAGRIATEKDLLEYELCLLIVDSACQSRRSTYYSVDSFYGNLSDRLCYLQRTFQHHFHGIFGDTYAAIQQGRFAAQDKQRTLSKLANFFGYLHASDAVDWTITMKDVEISEEKTERPDSRVFLKFFFQYLADTMGPAKLKLRLHDPTSFGGFPGSLSPLCGQASSSNKNIRYLVNFFTAIGLGFLAVDLRERLLDQTKK